jgi:hypothetical protein
MRHQSRVDEALNRSRSTFVSHPVIQPAIRSRGDCLMYALYNVLPPGQRAAVSSTDPGLLPEDAFRALILALGYDDTTRGFNTKDVRDYLFRRMAVGAIQDFVWEVYGHRQH